MSEDSPLSLYRRVGRFISSERFFYFVIALALLQTLWYAFSMKMAFYDEPQHFGLISFYAQHLSPFVSHQDMSWDFLGDISRNPNYLFYYLMSLPLRLIQLFTDSRMYQVIGLRLIMIAFFTGGLVYYRRVFNRLRISKAVSHSTLLAVVLIPNIIGLAATINYDNLVFLLFPIMLLWALQALRSEKIDIVNLARILIVALLSIEIKYEFLVLLAPVLAYLAYDLWKKHGGSLFSKTTAAFRKLSALPAALIIGGLLLSAGLFIERPVQNVVRYHNITPACVRIMEESRCRQNFVQNRNLDLLRDKPDNFTPWSPYDYAYLYWMPVMTTSLTRVLGISTPPPFIEFAYYTFVIAGTVLIILYLRDYMKVKALRFLLFVTLVYVLGLFLNNYLIYVHYGMPVAMNGRYLLPILPIFSVLALSSATKLLGEKHRNLLMGLGVVSLLFLLQGGGITSTVLSMPPNSYWKNDKVLQIKDGLKRVTEPVIKENGPFMHY
jgi:hypothetical protein